MAKKTNIKTKKQKEEETKDSVQLLNGLGRFEISAFSVGFILFLVAVFMIISFTSYVYSGSSDFDLLENPTSSDVLNEAYKFKNVCGSLGAIVSYFFINTTFGLASYVVPLFFIMLSMKLMKVYKVGIVRHFILMTLLLVWASVAFAAVASFFPSAELSFVNWGGNHGQYVVKKLTALIGKPGLFGVLIVFAILYFTYLSTKTVGYVRSALRMNFIRKVRFNKETFMRKENNAHSSDEMVGSVLPQPDIDKTNDAVKPVYEDPKANTLLFDLNGAAENNNVGQNDSASSSSDSNKVAVNSTDESMPDGNGEKDEVDLQIKDSVREKKTKASDEIVLDIETIKIPEESDGGLLAETDELKPFDPKLDLEFYKYPTLDLLDSSADSNPQIDMDEQNANKERIIEILRSFGVEISSIKATIGPTLTLYEITPATGVKISKIRNLEDDIALSLAAVGIRIIAPIPGKGTIGIEVPNKKQCIVSMESILNSRTYQETKMELPCALGKTITNDVFMIDLAKAPHLLVAGATGMGKSVGLNAIVTSLLYKKHPSEMKIVMVDPKKVEFSIYAPIEKHFLAKLEDEEEAIITDVQKVVNTLKSLCQLMDTRYDLLKKANVRNIKEYNEKFKRRELNPEKGHDFMPYIVVIIDEFGDLIMTAGREVELPICRIAQLARAVGIHMIIATQRPTTNIITGTIKANFPARIAFRVAAMMDSRTILDRPGANQLIGRGDMLVLKDADPVRVQCAFVDTPEVNRICKYISTQQSYTHALYLPEVVSEDLGVEHENTADMKHLDPMFAEVAKLVVSTQQGSTSLIQRKFSIGYNRAGRLMDQLEKAGVVGPQQGSKPRDVLITDLLTLDGLLNSIEM